MQALAHLLESRLPFGLQVNFRCLFVCVVTAKTYTTRNKGRMPSRSHCTHVNKSMKIPCAVLLSLSEQTKDAPELPRLLYAHCQCPLVEHIFLENAVQKQRQHQLLKKLFSFAAFVFLLRWGKPARKFLNFCSVSTELFFCFWFSFSTCLAKAYRTGKKNPALGFQEKTQDNSHSLTFKSTAYQSVCEVPTFGRGVQVNSSHPKPVPTNLKHLPVLTVRCKSINYSGPLIRNTTWYWVMVTAGNPLHFEL